MCSDVIHRGVGSVGVQSRGRRSESLISCGRALLWLLRSRSRGGSPPQLRSRGELSSGRGGEMEGSILPPTRSLASGGTSAPRARRLVAVNEPSSSFGEPRLSDRRPAASCLRCATRWASESVPRESPRPRLGTPGRGAQPGFAGEVSVGTGGEERGETCDDLEVVRALRSRSFAPAWSVGRLPLRCPTTRRGGAISFWRHAGRPQVVVVGSRLRAPGEIERHRASS